MTREEWIAYHDEHAKKHGENDLFREKQCTEIFSEEHGLFQYGFTEDNEMVMLECIGHLFFWNDLIPWVAKTFGCKRILAFATTDKPKRLERLYRSKAISCTNGMWTFERRIEDEL